MRSRRAERAARAVLAALRFAVSAAGTFAFILVMAGLPLLFSDAQRTFTFAPERILEAATAFLRGLADESIFIMQFGNTNWDFREIGLRYLLESMAYTAIPGALGLGLGAVAGIASRRRGKGLGGRLADLVLSTPDFLVIFLIQGAAAWLVHETGVRIVLGVTSSRLALMPMLAMTVFPFFFAYRASSRASRRAEGEEFIQSARARGIGERSIATRHLGAVVIPLLEAELPVLMAFMQGSLFVTEQTFLIPGMSRFLFLSAFSGGKKWVFGPVYQYNPAVLALAGLVISCAVTYAGLRLALAAARKALTHE